MIEKEYFIDGDISDRVEKYSKYKLCLVEIDEIDIDEFYYDEDVVSDYIDMYNSKGVYPPIVLESEYMGMYTIIDGTHRSQALYSIGLTKIKAFIGID